MNELIKQLALEAEFDYDVHGSNDGNFYGYEGRWINQEIVEMTRLVVQRCTRVLLSHGAVAKDPEPYHYAASLLEDEMFRR